MGGAVRFRRITSSSRWPQSTHRCNGNVLSMRASSRSMPQSITIRPPHRLHTLLIVSFMALPSVTVFSRLLGFIGNLSTSFMAHITLTKRCRPPIIRSGSLRSWSCFAMPLWWQPPPLLSPGTPLHRCRPQVWGRAHGPHPMRSPPHRYHRTTP
jgi:hypothetical protein